MVGLLAAAWLGTVLPAGVRDPWDVVVALAGLALLMAARLNVLWVVLGVVVVSAARGQF